MSKSYYDNRSDKKVLAFFILSLLFWIAVTVPLGAFGDDWYYKTTPNVRFEFSQLLPDGTAFWRPLDVLFGALLGLCPNLFPLLNHVLVAFGHVLGCVFLYFILKDHFQMKALPIYGALLIFMFGSGNFAAVASVDSLNQVWSSTFGIAAFLFYIKRYNGGSFLNLIMYYLFCILSLFTKESGIMWGFLIPVLCILPEICSFGDIFGKHKFVRYEIAFAVICVLYFAARIGLSRQGAVADADYSVSLSVAGIFRGFAMMIAGSVVSVDTVALFVRPQDMALVSLTVILNIPWMITMVSLFIRKLCDKKKVLSFLILLLCSLAAMLPNAVTTVGEMHCYVFTFFLSLIVAMMLENSEALLEVKVAFVASLCMFLVSCGFVGVHKWKCLDESAKNSYTVLNQIQERYADKEPPENVLVVCVLDGDEGYSIYSQPVANGSYYGFASKSLWDWEYPKRIKAVYVNSTLEANEYVLRQELPDGYDAEWVVNSEGKVRFIR